MPETSKKPRKTKPSDGERFINKLGKAPTFALKEIATALHVTCRGTQAELLDALRSGHLIASVCWPDPTVAVDLPTSLWGGIRTEDFTVREKGLQGWHHYDYELSRARLVRQLIVPRLRAIQGQLKTAPEARTAVGAHQPNADHADILQQFDLAIQALEKSGATAEVFVTPQNARVFAIEYFGSISRRGPGAPKTEPEHINAALIEAFRRLHGVDPRPSQKTLCYEMLQWWNRTFETRSESWIRNNILRPIWKALKLPADA